MGRGQLVDPRPAQQQGGASDARARQRPEPQPHLDELAVHGHPLRFGLRGDQIPVVTWAEFDADGHPFG